MAARMLRLATSNGVREPDWADALAKHPEVPHWIDQMRADWRQRHPPQSRPRSPSARPSKACLWPVQLQDPDEWELAARKYPESRHLAMELRELLKNRKRPG